GAILAKWLSLGGEHNSWGVPIGDEQLAPDGIGRFVKLEDGSVIYWAPRMESAKVINGGIFAVWQATGGAASSVGLPTGELNLGEGVQWQAFERGVIYWATGTGAHELRSGVADNFLNSSILVRDPYSSFQDGYMRSLVGSHFQ